MLAHFRYVGVLNIEFFVRRGRLLANETAPRVHNSGHWTIEGALTSQFENHIRAICGLPLGETALAAKGVEMWNLIGDEARDWGPILSDPRNHLHLYGKQPRDYMVCMKTGRPLDGPLSRSAMISSRLARR